MFTMRAFPMPLVPFTAMRRELDNLFNELADVDGGAGRVFPALNVWEDGERVMVEAETPGFRLEDLEISVDDSTLTIRGTRQDTKEDKNLSYHRRERMIDSFTRSIRLPYEIDTDKVEATLRDGVLSLMLPKAATARTRKITVKQG